MLVPSTYCSVLYSGSENPSFADFFLLFSARGQHQMSRQAARKVFSCASWALDLIPLHLEMLALLAAKREDCPCPFFGF